MNCYNDLLLLLIGSFLFIDVTVGQERSITTIGWKRKIGIV